MCVCVCTLHKLSTLKKKKKEDIFLAIFISTKKANETIRYDIKKVSRLVLYI